VRIIVPFAAGGPTDVIGRIVGEQLSKSWGQQVVIENRERRGTPSDIAYRHASFPIEVALPRNSIQKPP
jgi:hypothetical protein